MKKSKNLIIILSTCLIVIGIIVSAILTKFSNEISTIVTAITAVVGAVALWFQFKNDNKINTASFVMEFYKSFTSNEDNMKVLAVLDNKFDGFDKDISLVNLRNEIQSYLGWIKTLCDLIEQGVLAFESIDELFSYEFFSIVDNKEIQEWELVKYPWLYKNIYIVHRKWTAYRKKRGTYNNVYSDEDFSLVPNYKEYSK